MRRALAQAKHLYSIARHVQKHARLVSDSRAGVGATA
jgi:hypothetical protein